MTGRETLLRLPKDVLRTPAGARFLQCKSLQPVFSAPHTALAPPGLDETPNGPGRPLDPSTRTFMEPRFGHDLSQVRIHTGSQSVESARSVNAAAYTVGQDIIFGAGQYAPTTPGGLNLLAHELTHTVQQKSASPSEPARVDLSGQGGVMEAEAESAADAVTRGTETPAIGMRGNFAIQRRVEMRDVGRGEQSGFARLPELINRLNDMSQGLTFAHSGNSGDPLTYELKVGGTLSGFDKQMQAFIDQGAVIPLRLTNRRGLLGSHAAGFHTQVDVDAWRSGYVDIDDLLSSSDLGLQSVLVHFLRERSATSNYARRIGTASFTQPEFQRVHGSGIGAEEQLLRDYFGDPTIRIVNDSPSPAIRRVFRNSRHDFIRRRVHLGRGDESGVNAMSIDVVTRDGKTHTPEKCRISLHLIPQNHEKDHGLNTTASQGETKTTFRLATVRLFAAEGLRLRIGIPERLLGSTHRPRSAAVTRTAAGR